MQLIFSNQHPCFTDDEIDDVSALRQNIWAGSVSVIINA